VAVAGAPAPVNVVAEVAAYVLHANAVVEEAGAPASVNAGALAAYVLRVNVAVYAHAADVAVHAHALNAVAEVAYAPPVQVKADAQAVAMVVQ